MSSACGQARRRSNWCQGHNHKERVANIHLLISIAQPQMPSMTKTLTLPIGPATISTSGKISQVITVMGSNFNLELHHKYMYFLEIFILYTRLSEI